MPRSELDRQNIKRQMTSAQAMAPSVIPRYFVTEREKFLAAAMQQGCDMNQSVAVLDQHGIWARDMAQFIDCYRQPQSPNVLLMYPLGQQTFNQQMAVNPVMQNMAAGMQEAMF